MKTKIQNLFIVLAMFAGIHQAAAQGTVFNYQGRLNDGGQPANGTNYGMVFYLYDAPTNGNLLGDLGIVSVTVSNGLFTVPLDFGDEFDGNPRWLQISVQKNGGLFTQLAPRQQLTPVPYAIFANTASNLTGNASTATTANNFSGSLSGDVTGTQNATVVSSVDGLSASSVAAGASYANAASSTGGQNNIVSRDGSGDFTANTITLNGTLNVVNSEENVAIGAGALNSANSSSANDTGTGSYALFKNTSGSDNTANGEGSLYFNTSGGNNTASGAFALYKNTGSDNTAMGMQALYNNTGGTNIGVGYDAGVNLTTGNNNIEIGNQGTSSDNNVIKIGTQNTQTSTFIAGISGATASSGVAVYVNSSGQLGTLTSSRRYKQDIQDMSQASDVLYSLKPVTFKYKPGIDPQGIPQFGLVAEDVEKVAPDLVAHDDQGKIYTVRYQAVDAMLLNEFLKEHRTVENENKEIEQLQQTVAELKDTVSKLMETQKTKEQQ